MNIVTTMKGSPKVGKIAVTAVTEPLLFPERNREKNKNVPNDNPIGSSVNGYRYARTVSCVYAQLGSAPSFGGVS
ncbi:hypothetical protein [Paenibacillus sp. YIM B09110]|uniref:hypothetical protein n=1 Tax=Paenibacillus sp. YIM B09110 TaxID=3126102 RepID=UPI00301B7AD4